MGKRLELCWPNKDKVLLGLDADGTPRWGTKDDIEARLLVQLEAVGQVNPDNPNDLYAQGDNLLIKGDNLLALKTLERHFAGKIKCIYIDPPFNTGNAFEHYDDGLEHTIWLSMMRPRLEMLWRLLRHDGSLWLQLDDQEVHYCKVVLDEIFGRSNFVSSIIWFKKHTTANDARYLSDNHDHILVYARELDELRLNLLPRTEIQDSRYENPDNDPRGPWASQPLQVKTPSEKYIYEIVTPAGRKTWPPKGRSWAFSKERYEELVADGRIWFGESGNNVPRGKGFLSEVRQGVIPRTIWLRQEVGDNQEGKAEMKAMFPESPFGTPKPERLMRRVVELATNPGDWVLDSFVGSGTTSAVAMKLRRKCIGIELGEHAETHCLPRLRKVSSGQDDSGISKQVGWEGGGGFRYCVLGDSLFAKDDDTGLVMINPEYDNGPLVAAVCAMEDFALNDDSVLQGRRGNLFAHVTEEKLTQAYVDELMGRLPETCGLNVYCMKRDRQLEFPADRVRIRRIPKDLRVPPYLRGNGNGGAQQHLPFTAPSQEEDPAMKRKAKDPRPLIRLLRNARLKGPKDWAKNIDRYIYGPTAGDASEEEAGKGAERK